MEERCSCGQDCEAQSPVTATLTFRLPDAKGDLLRALKATDYLIVLFDLDQKLRSICKYEDLPAPVQDKVEEIREEFWELCRGKGVDPVEELE